MFSVLRSRLSYANVVATLALLFAMSGGALAASKFLITSTKQIKPSVLAQLKGRNGKNGAQGLAGPAGPAGTAGPQGPAGANGKDGTSGTNGTGATTASFSGSQHGCKEGGLEVKSASAATFVCNGEKGANGLTGFTETLPSGKTETGTWSVNLGKAAEEELVLEPISFPIKLSAGGESVYLNAQETSTEAGTGGCTGSVAEPTAPAGKLCLYTLEEEVEGLQSKVKTLFEGTNRYGAPGAFLEFLIQSGGNAHAYGSWAVTAP
jgi:hypothetical protein